MRKQKGNEKSYGSVELLCTMIFNSPSNINVDGPINYWSLKNVNTRESKNYTHLIFLPIQFSMNIHRGSEGPSSSYPKTKGKRTTEFQPYIVALLLVSPPSKHSSEGSTKSMFQRHLLHENRQNTKVH